MQLQTDAGRGAHSPVASGQVVESASSRHAAAPSAPSWQPRARRSVGAVGDTVVLLTAPLRPC